MILQLSSIITLSAMFSSLANSYSMSDKRESHNIYAKTREECEEKLAEMIVQVKAQIKAEKEKMTG